MVLVYHEYIDSDQSASRCEIRTSKRLLIFIIYIVMEQNGYRLHSFSHRVYNNRVILNCCIMYSYELVVSMLHQGIIQSIKHHDTPW